MYPGAAQHSGRARAQRAGYRIRMRFILSEVRARCVGPPDAAPSASGVLSYAILLPSMLCYASGFRMIHVGKSCVESSLVLATYSVA